MLMKTPTIDCICIVCGKQFKGYHKLQKYCSDGCKQEAYKITCCICGKVRSHSSFLRRKDGMGLCRRCYGYFVNSENITEILSVYQHIDLLIRRIQLYEQMFNSQQTQIEELLEVNKEFKRKQRMKWEDMINEYPEDT